MDQINRWFNYFSIVKCNQTNGPDAKDQCFSITSLLQNTAYIPTLSRCLLSIFFLITLCLVIVMKEQKHKQLIASVQGVILK
jgi:hypothetical protein